MHRTLALLVVLAAGGCASHSTAKIEAYCQRYAAKHMAFGVHRDLDAYREDLMSSCMAMREVPYPATAQAQASGESAAR